MMTVSADGDRGATAAAADGADDGKYPAAVEAAIASCLPSEDPLDSKEFDAVAFVNERFPDEKSFAGLDPFLAQLRAQVGDLDTSIFDAVKAQSTQASKATAEIAEAKQSIVQLQSKVRDIKGKAEQSEVMVQEICRDIKKLDYAKRHLTYTITSLKRFHMLVTAVDQLDFMVESRQYQETANLLQAVAQLLVHFEQHSEIPSVRKMRDSVAKTRTSLTDQIFRDFEALSEVSADYSLMEGRRSASAGSPATNAPAAQAAGSSLFLGAESQIGGPHPRQEEHTYDDPVASSESLFYSSDAHTPESLAGACAVVDALGSKVRRKLIDKVCQIWLKPYDVLFGPGEEHSGLESTDRRYAWLRRVLRDNEDRFQGIFPSSWCINKHLVVAFVKRTEAHLKTELRKIDPPDSADVSALVRALRKTLDFEHEMAIRFESKRSRQNGSPDLEEGGDDQATDDGDDTDTSSLEGPDSDGRNALFDDVGERVDPMSAKGIRLRRERAAACASAVDSAATAKAASASGGDSGRGEPADELQASRAEALADAKALGSLRGVVSSVFEPYLAAYVKLEGSKMREELETFVKEESVESEGALNLTSASNMFLLIQKSINRCVQFTTGQAFYDLYNEFKRVMAWYSGALEQKLPRQGQPLTHASVTMACFVCNSAEYCVDTVPQLEERVKDKINEAFRDAIDMEDVEDKFSGNLQSSIRALVGGVHAAIEPDLAAAARTNWAALQQVGDTSRYVATLSATLRDHAPQIRSQLRNEAYFVSFCSGFADSFIDRFRGTILRCRKVGEMGAQQLLLDAVAVKSVLLKLPSLGLDPAEAADQPAAFSVHAKKVGEPMRRIEGQLKLVSMNLSIESLLDSFKALLEDGDTEHLRMILEMKGFKKPDIASALKQAEAAGIPVGRPAPPPPSGSGMGSGAGGAFYMNMAAEAAAAAGGAGAASGAGASFTNVFSKMSDMKETLDKVASSTSGGKGFSSISATFQQSYNRAVNKRKDPASGAE